MSAPLKVLLVGAKSLEAALQASLAGIPGQTRLSHTDTRLHAMELIRDGGHFDVIFCHVDRNPDSVADLYGAMMHERITVPIVACSATSDPMLAARAVRDGAVEFITVPPDQAGAPLVLDRVVGRGSSMITFDPVAVACLAQARRIAQSDASVLICGESGTGKEVMARYIHGHSHRCKSPFVAVNCAAIPDALLESELFGHEKGAFSGAIARRIGRFEAASGGTLLLDEISEMDFRLQAKLLRAIQEREVDRLGAHGPVQVNTRILATSNRDLYTEVLQGRFRADLYYRLDVVRLRIPPLRERSCDIVPLARHYARRYASLNGLQHRSLSEQALVALESYRWPGNIRELENTIHRAVLLADADTIEADTLGLTRPAHPHVASPANAANSTLPALVGQTVSRVEQGLILETLRHTCGNRTRAADLLGISIRALRNKLKDYAAQGIAVPAPELRPVV